MNDLQARARVLAEQTGDAYSWDNYGEDRWRAAITMLLRRGFSDREVEAILRSKWTRWAADQASDRKGWRYGHTTSADLARFLDTMTPEQLKSEVRALTTETFGSEE